MNVYRFLDVLQASSAEELKDLIASIKMPVKVLHIYHDGKNHVAWVNLPSPLKKNDALKKN